MREFYIIGAGMGTKDTLTAEAARVLDETKTVFATARLAELCPQAQVCAFSALAECAVSCDADRVALLVSGDVGFFSAAGKLREKLLKYGEVKLFCGLSSMQYLCAKVGVSYENACIKSLHGRNGDVLGAVSYHEKTFVLTGGDNNAAEICRSLSEAGLGRVPGVSRRKPGRGGRTNFAGDSGRNCEILLRKPCGASAYQSILFQFK